MAAAPTAVAGSPPSSVPADAEQIIVTGERVSRTHKDTPSSVVVFDRHDLDRLAAPDRVQDLLALVPNVVIGARRDTPVIRGQNSAGVLGGLPAFLGGARPRTVLQVDGRAITFNEFAFGSQGLWDVDQVEIFRSPQTTTQGVNSIAGAIFIHTIDPSYRFEGHAQAIAGELGRRQVSVAVSAPLIPDQLALRISGDLYRGHSSNLLAGPIAGVDLNKDRYGTIRAKLLAEPKALPGLRVLLTYAHSQSQSPQAEPSRPPFKQRRDLAYIFGYFKVNVDSLTNAIRFPITPALQSRTTLSGGDSSFQRFAPQGFGQTRIHGRDGSLESLLEWKPDMPVEAIGGISIQGTNLHQFIDLSVTPLGSGRFDDRQRSRALFGEATWHPTARLSLTGGGRYQLDRRERSGVLGTSPLLPIEYRKSVRALLPKVSAAYDFSGSMRVGLLVERAYNPGGVTLDPSRAAIVQFDPEYLWDYEAFTRARLFGGALSVTGNLFYNDIKNAQRTLDICLETPTGCVGLSRIANAPAGHSSGAELELVYTASPRLTLRGAAGLLRTKITRTILPGDAILGREFAGSPKLTATAVVDWEPVADLRLSAQLRHSSRYFTDDAETPDFRIEPVTTLDARASWRTGRVTVFVYAQNIFDTFHITGWYLPRSNPNVEVTTNDPREIGFGIEAGF